MAEHFTLGPNCKYAILAIHNVRVEVPPNLILQDDTRVALETFPFALDDHWKDWLGTIQFNELKACNLFLVRTATEGWPEGHLPISGDEVSQRLQHEVGGLFAMLRMLGTIEYEDAFMLAGYVQEGKPTCKHFAQTERFNITRGCLPWLIKEEDLRAAAQLFKTYSVLQQKYLNAESWRFGRGCNCLKTGLEQYYASDRLHGFVRALEAVILPEPGKTEKQFVSRCALFAGPKAAEANLRTILQEAYRMRCDIEHVHDWDRSLQTYPVDDRENVALWRTRQMEALACAANTRILRDTSIQQHFHSDAAIAAFWQKSEDEIRAAFGNICDITQLKIVRKYDGIGRAAASEWPTGWLDNLRREAKSA
jgi:hypothetical protein